MINIDRTKNTDDICAIIELLSRYFKSYEMVNSDEIHYYADCYDKLYPGEDFFIYKITDNDRLIGCALGVSLSEFIVIVYFTIEEQDRSKSMAVIKMAIDKIKSLNKPIVVEAESEALCRLYRMFGFKRFTEPYEYATPKVLQSKIDIETHKSNLLYLNNDVMMFDNVRDILYFKHYLRWYSIYNSEFVEKYKERLNLIIENN